MITNRNFELQLAGVESGGLRNAIPSSEPELSGGGLTPNSRRQGCTQGCIGWVDSGDNNVGPILAKLGSYLQN